MSTGRILRCAWRLGAVGAAAESNAAGPLTHDVGTSLRTLTVASRDIWDQVGLRRPLSGLWVTQVLFWAMRLRDQTYSPRIQKHTCDMIFSVHASIPTIHGKQAAQPGPCWINNRAVQGKDTPLWLPPCEGCSLEDPHGLHRPLGMHWEDRLLRSRARG